MRLLFVKSSLAWPRASGHDVYTYNMMKACASNGHEVSLATVDPPVAQAVEGLTLDRLFEVEAAGQPSGDIPLNGSLLQRRFRSFWGVPDERLRRLAHIVDDYRPEVVIVAGLDALPYFPVLSGVIRVWHAADEWVCHHLSQVRFRDPDARSHLHAAAVKGLYERAHARVVDRVWLVSDVDRLAMRWLGGMKGAEVVPLGVDGEHFRPGGETPDGRSAIFWGRLDFGPNIQALTWFCETVWPLVRRRAADARFTIAGFNPTDGVRALGGLDGVSIAPNVPDLRDLIRRHAVVVMPFVSGWGIKNKLLEAAALGMPILGTPRACNGLRGLTGTELLSLRRPNEWADALVSLWDNADRRAALGLAARRWVIANHDWREIARDAIESLRTAPYPPARRANTMYAG